MDVPLQILLLIALIILLAKAVGGLCVKLSLPVVLGELLAGVLLGPTVINVWRFPWFAPPEGHAVSLAAFIKVLADLGVVVLMFLVGLETDVERLRSSLGAAFWSAMGGVLLPLAGGAFVMRAAGFGWGAALLVGAVLTATSVSITAQTLLNLNQLRTKVGSTILGAAVIDDVLGLIVLSLVLAGRTHDPATVSSAGWGLAKIFGRIVLFAAVIYLVGARLTRLMFGAARRFAGAHTPVATALALAFLFALFAEVVGGMAAITGSYVAGLLVALTPAHGEVLRDTRALSNGFFSPLFFASIGLAINARSLGGNIGLFLVLLLVAVAGKVVGCGLGAFLKGLKLREAVTVGVGMIPRGEVELITASVGWSAGLISGELFALLVVVVLAASLLTPVLLRLSFPRPLVDLAPAPVPSPGAAGPCEPK